MTRGRLKIRVLAKLEPSNPANRVCITCMQEQSLANFTLYRGKYFSHTCKSCARKKYPLLPCSVCGTLRHVELINGKPKSLTCVKCADRSKQAEAMRQANIGRPRPDTATRQEATRLYALIPPDNPQLGELSWYGVHKCVLAACSKCGKERWVQVGLCRQPKFNMCSMCTMQDEELVKKRSQKQWGSPKKKDETLRRLARAQNRKPNKPEQVVLHLLNELYPDDWMYVGDGRLVIEGRNPDFVNCNGKKLIIEVFGDYWHGERARCYEETEDGRIALFERYGYKTLVIWESELKDVVSVIARVKEFSSC